MRLINHNLVKAFIFMNFDNIKYNTAYAGKNNMFFAGFYVSKYSTKIPAKKYRTD